MRRALSRPFASSRPRSWLSVSALLIAVAATSGCGSLGYILREEPYRQQVLALVAAREGDHVVDIGCQDGYWSYEFAREVGAMGRVYALDIEQKWVDHTRKESQRRGWNQIEPVLCLENDTTLDADAVDIIFFANTIHHIQDIPSYTEHLYQVLRPGGKYVVIDSSRGRSGHNSDPHAIRLLTTAAGFVVTLEHRFAGTHRYLIVFQKPVQ